MKKFISAIFMVLVFSLIPVLNLSAQDSPLTPSVIKTGVFLGETPPLKDIPALTASEMLEMQEKAEKKVLNAKLRYRSYPYAETAFPKGPDAVWQKEQGGDVAPQAPIVNFAGQSTTAYPPDCNGTAGPNHYMQTVNSTYAIYSKTGSLLAGPTNMNLLFNGVPGANCNDGDPLIQYDEMAGRWLAVEFSLCGSTDRMLIAVSSTNDPTGTWYAYSFDVDDMPDYEKVGIWQDGYYMGMNNSSTKDIYVFERSVMLTGGANPQMVGFNNAWRPSTIDGFVCVPPVDNDGVAAPAGVPGLFIAMNDDAIGGGSDQLWIYELDVDWANTAASTFNRVQQINVSAFDSNFGTDWDNISQPGTSRQLDAIPQVIMNVPQYRNFGTYETIVCCHTVDVDNTDHAGIRWYELRRVGAGAWTIRQQGTYAPDVHSRWMGSVMLNANGKIGLGYSISSATVYPGIRYTGQSSAAYASASGIMDVPEEVIWTGAASQTAYNRWGDYSLMSVDPADNETFWFTTHYFASGSTKGSRIASFKIGNAPIVVTLPATAITTGSATLNGTVNPNGLATDYYFQWGTSTSYGTNTTTTAAGSGTTALSVNVPLTGLTAGQTYHFRLVGVNADGTTYGQDQSFTPGGAAVTTAAISNITLTTATGGGNVVSDGGMAVTARGVCWGTSSNPTIAGSHTVDGAGLGSFTSNITGLSSNTTYYVRAYATNGSGTYYGSNVQFTTLCGIYTLPFSESFSGTTIPTCWSQVDLQGNGQIWQFGTITGYTPAPALTGNYAYLNSDAYGSGNSQNADLITPTLNMSGYTNVTLQFNHFFRQYTGSSGKLSYSIDNGSTWNLLATFSTTTANPATYNQVITAVAGQPQVKFKWNYTGTWGYYWAIDNVSITGTASGPFLTVTPSNQSVPATAGSTAFSVGCSTNWTAVSDASWCTVTASGSGNGTLTANYLANSGVARVANITVSASGLPNVVVTVSQSAFVPTLLVTPNNRDVDATSGNTTFSVTSNSAWTVTSNSAWCTVTPSGTGNGTITANYEENLVISPRQATITVTVAGFGSQNVTVSQSGATPFMTVTPSNQNVSPNSGTTNFGVSSNVDWAVSSNASWCIVNTPTGSLNGPINITYTENTSVVARTATITVTGTSVNPVSVTVTQEGAAPILAVTPPNQDVTAPAGSVNFNIVSNTSWTATSNVGWCTVDAAGNGNGTILVTYLENTSMTSRIAYVSVMVAGLDPVVVSVTQAAAGAMIAVSPALQNVTAPSGICNFSVISNSSWTAQSDAAWCSVTTSGSGNGTIECAYNGNGMAFERTANITVTVAGIDPVTVQVIQAPADPYLNVLPLVDTVSYQAGAFNYEVQSNGFWTVNSDSPWCTTTLSGTGNGTLTASYVENATGAFRTANITISVAGIPEVFAKLVQLPSFVSNDKADKAGYSIYPNPNTGKFELRGAGNDVRNIQVTIYDARGKEVMRKECIGSSRYAFDMTSFAKGTYMLKAETREGTFNWQLILQ